MENQERNYRDLLQSKYRDDLNSLAKELRIPRFRKLSKSDLITAILKTSLPVPAAQLARSSWWTRNYNHVYGFAGLVGAFLSAIGLVLAVVLFLRQDSPPSSGSNVEVTSNATDSAGEAGSTNQDQAEAAIAADAGSFSPVSMEEFFETVFNRNITQIQRDDFLARQIGRRVIWEGKLADVSGSSRESTLMIRCEAVPGRFAFFEFPTTNRGDLLALKRDQRVKVSGILREWNVNYVNLEKSQLLKIWP